VALANRSKYGLQGCVFTADINKAIQLSDALETGTVQINSAPARGPDHFPFQGLKDSGIGSQVGARSHADRTPKTLSRPSGARRSLVKCPRREVRSVGPCGQGITNSINLMCKTKSTVINLPKPSYTMG